MPHACTTDAAHKQIQNGSVLAACSNLQLQQQLGRAFALKHTPAKVCATPNLLHQQKPPGPPGQHNLHHYTHVSQGSSNNPYPKPQHSAVVNPLHMLPWINHGGHLPILCGAVSMQPARLCCRCARAQVPQSCWGLRYRCFIECSQPCCAGALRHDSECIHPSSMV